MTPTVILFAAVVVLLSVLTWQLVLTLQQTRRTVLAMEQFLAATRPDIQQAVERVNRVMGRADHLTGALEEGGNRVGAAISGVAEAFSGAWSGPREGGPSGRTSGFMTTISAVTAIVSGFANAWSAVSQHRASAAREDSEGGSAEGGSADE